LAGQDSGLERRLGPVCLHQNAGLETTNDRRFPLSPILARGHVSDPVQQRRRHNLGTQFGELLNMHNPGHLFANYASDRIM
jgi:hypothetical protein